MQPDGVVRLTSRSLTRNVWIAVFRGKFIALNAYIKIAEMSKTHNLSFEFMKPEKEKKIRS